MEQWLIDYQNWIFIMLFLAAYFENLFPPLPGDTIVVIGAFWVAQGQISFVVTWLAASCGSFFGFLTYFLISYRYGHNIFKYRWLKSHRNQQRLDEVRRWFQHWGLWVVLANRFLPGARSIISIAAGTFRYSIPYVTLSAMISSLLWNLLIVLAATMFKLNSKQIISLIQQYNLYIGIVIAVLIITLVVYKYSPKILKKVTK